MSFSKSWLISLLAHADLRKFMCGRADAAILADFCQKTGMKLRVLKQMKQYDQMVKTMTSSCDMLGTELNMLC